MTISHLIPCYKVHWELQEILLTIFAVLTTISFQKLLITVLSFSKQKLKSHTLQTTAKKSHMENSMKVTPLIHSSHPSQETVF